MSSGEVKQIDGKRVASPEYRSWQMMKNRCLNPKAMDYSYYGGRGIKLDPRWHDFNAFLEDMGRRPTATHTLERLNTDGPYYKLNCKWATRKEQGRNRPRYLVFSEELATDIRRYYATGLYRQKDIAEWYGTSQSHISQIVRRKMWA